MLSTTTLKLLAECHPSLTVLVEVMPAWSAGLPKQIHKVREFLILALVEVKQSPIRVHQVMPPWQELLCQELANAPHMLVLGQFAVTTSQSILVLVSPSCCNFRDVSMRRISRSYGNR